jgi:hypothetical protein
VTRKAKGAILGRLQEMGMRITTLGAAACCLAASAPAAAAEWKLAGLFGQVPDRKLLYVDQASVRRLSATQVSVETQTYQEKAGSAPPSGEAYNIVAITYRFDCPGGSFAILRTSTHGATGQVGTPSDAEQPALPLTPGSPLHNLAGAACSDDFSTFAAAGRSGPLADGAERLAQAAALSTSLTGSGWQHLGAAGSAPGRYAFYLNRDSIVPDGPGAKLVTTMVIAETPEQGVKRFHHRLRIHCRARTTAIVYQRAYGADGKLLGEDFPGGPPRTVSESSPYALMFRPACANDWAIARAAQGNAGEIANEPFPQ